MTPTVRRFEIGSTEQVLNDVRVLRRSFAHQDIPDNAVPFFVTGSAPTPAFSLPATLANQITLCTYQCPIGWEGYLMDVMLFLSGDAGSFVPGSGDVVWTIDIDRPLASPLASGRWVAGFSAITRPMGDFSGPWPIARELRGWKMKTGETYRAKVYTVQNVAVGNPSYCHASLQGIVWPKC